jgi:predicted esterase
MPGRLPSKDDGIPSTYAIVPPPKGQPPTNVLILLHGLGDSEAPFKSFGEKLQLPETACISLRGPTNLPFDLQGAHWGDDIVFDNDGTIDLDTGFKRGTKRVLDDVIRKVLVDKCGYRLREILLFGFGHGGMLALNIAAELGRDDELGGVVSIGGPLPANASLPEVGKKSRTPVLLCHGYRQSAIKGEDVDKLKDFFDFVDIKEWRKTGDGMPASRDEMMPIMQFWARRLRSRRGVPKGSVEIT